MDMSYEPLRPTIQRISKRGGSSCVFSGVAAGVDRRGGGGAVSSEGGAAEERITITRVL